MGRNLLVAGLAACLGVSGPPARASAAAAAATTLKVPPAGSYYHGVYPGGVSTEEDDVTPEGVASYESAVGRRVAWVYFSHNWYHGRSFPLAAATWIRDSGAVPFIRLMLRSSDAQNQPEPVYTVAAIASGAFDADLAAWGDAAREFGTPLAVEWGTEVNGEWFSWNGRWNGGAGEGPRLFREAYRRIVTVLRSRGANNLTFAFHVNDEDIPGEDWNRLENYYPGDDVVDWVGASVYGAGTPTADEWPLFSAGIDVVVPRLVALAPSKPVFVFEFGCTSGNPRGDPAAWADQALADLLANRWPAVRGFSWWNETWQNDENRAHDTDMQVQTVPGLAAVFRARLAASNVVDRPILE